MPIAGMGIGFDAVNGTIEDCVRKFVLKSGPIKGSVARAASEDREEILAALEFEKWLAETCAVCLEKD